MDGGGRALSGTNAEVEQRREQLAEVSTLEPLDSGLRRNDDISSTNAKHFFLRNRVH
jgi:hypothetical protein